MTITERLAAFAKYLINGGKISIQGVENLQSKLDENQDLAASKQSPATTLAGYGITDAATSAQGAKADTAVQPSALTTVDTNAKNASNLSSGTVPNSRLTTGTTSTPGILQLNSTVTSTSTSLAATPSAVKTAYDLAASKQSPATTLVGYGITDAVTTATFNTFTGTKGVANGLASLGSDGFIPESQIPSVAITDTFEVASQAAMLALTAQRGDVAVRSDLNKSFILRATPASTLTNWTELRTPTDAVLSVAGLTGAIGNIDLKSALAITQSDVSGLATTLSGKADKVVTLSGYGITDAATSTQGAKADTAVQPSGLTPYATTTALTTVDTNAKNASNLTSGTVPNARLTTATTSVAGIVQLDNTLNSTSNSLASTPSAVKIVNDKVVVIENAKGAINGYASLDSTGKVPASQLGATGLTVSQVYAYNLHFGS